MKNTDVRHARTARPDELELAGHLGLALLNTVSLDQGKTIDLFRRDRDVRNWLQRVGLRVPGRVNPSRGSLLSSALSLREALRKNILRRKANRPLDLTGINAFLASACSHLQIRAEQGTGYRLRRQWASETAKQLLAPVAEAAAELLVQKNIEMVKQCEGDDCVLWFLDTTKAHARRWCSMATCGNRAKVSSYRSRAKDGKPLSTKLSLAGARLGRSPVERAQN
jgi:predicted RNA-binding Zn ribbon-like protein